MRRFFLYLVIVLMALWVFSCKTASKEDEVWEAYNTALVKYQHESYRVMSTQLPEESQLLAKYRDYSLIGFEEKTARFNFLLKNFPERIIRDKEIYGYVNFEWTNQDRVAFHESNPEAAELEKRRLSLWQEIEPQWTRLQERMKTVYISEEYKEIQIPHRNRLKEVEVMLNK